MLEFKNPLPLITPHGNAYAIYVESGGIYENDVITCVLCETGEIKHYTTEQVRVCKNGTFDIKNETK